MKIDHEYIRYRCQQMEYDMPQKVLNQYYEKFSKTAIKCAIKKFLLNIWLSATHLAHTTPGQTKTMVSDLVVLAKSCAVFLGIGII